MRIILDNIIFSLQQSGGISVYWYHHLKRLMQQGVYKPVFIEQHVTHDNMFRKLLHIPEKELFPTKKIPLIGRYINFNFEETEEQAIFHSSYYRFSKNPKHINITTVHDFTYEHFSTGLKRFVHSTQKKNAILNAHGIICISENTKKDLLKFVPEAANKPIRVIHNGVDQGVFDPKAVLWAKFPYAPLQYVVYVGDRKAKYKNFKLAVETCALINKSLILVGGGLITEQERQLLDKQLSGPGYKYLGHITFKALNQVYSNALCLLYPSSYEGFGIPTIEAQMAGCPVVASSTSSIPEIVGKGAILVEQHTAEAFSEAIQQLESAKFREELIAEGIENSKQYNWENTYTQTTEFYRELAEQYHN